jgi:GNAT superfamily N-acetyltransferase
VTAPIVEHLANFQGYYPGILEWFAGLKDELNNGRRTIIVCWDGRKIDGVAITKNGLRAKLCHISVAPHSRNRGIGRALMRLAVSEMHRHGAKEIRVTTSEEVFRQYGCFFSRAGFYVVDWQVNRYRKNSSELLWKRDLEPYRCETDWAVDSLASARTCSIGASSRFGKASMLSQIPLSANFVVISGGDETSEPATSIYFRTCDRSFPPSSLWLCPDPYSRMTHMGLYSSGRLSERTIAINPK